MPAAEPADAGATRVVDCFYNRDGHSDFGSWTWRTERCVEAGGRIDAAFVDRYLNDGDVDAGELTRRSNRPCVKGT